MSDSPLVIYIAETMCYCRPPDVRAPVVRTIVQVNHDLLNMM